MPVSRVPVSRVIPIAVSAVLVAAGAIVLVLASGLRDDPAAGNQALTNAALTRQVTAAVSADMEEVYSYDYTDLSATTGAARRVLAGKAAAQYAELSRVLAGAVREKVIVSTKVTSIGVESLSANSASLLVFLRQDTTRAGKPARPVGGQLRVTAERRRGQWLITAISAR